MALKRVALAVNGKRVEAEVQTAEEVA